MNNMFREQFPFFHSKQVWTYLDSAATTLKPEILSTITTDFYQSGGSVHRSPYDLAQSVRYETARDLVAEYFNTEDREAVVWTSGTTHALNLIANGLAHQIEAGDEIIVSVAEHHANFIPWQQLALQKQAKLIVLPVNEQFQINPETLRQALTERTKIVALNLISNVTGIRQPVEQLIPLIRQHSSAFVVLDIAQAVIREDIDVQAMDADFYAFSAHKMYGPTGVGVLMGKLQSLAQLRPLLFGGKMLLDVDTENLVLADLPYCLEAGTPNIAGIVGFATVLEWWNEWNTPQINNILMRLAENVYKRLKSYPNVLLLGDKPRTTFSFALTDYHHDDIADILTEQKIAIRAGSHCAKPYLKYLEKTGTLRISLAHYNTMDDIDRFFRAFENTLEVMK